jgi:WD40 repeat protein
MKYKLHRPHSAWSQKVRCGTEVGSFISMSSESDASLAYYDATTVLDCKTHILSVSKGISSFDYDEGLDLIVTGNRLGIVNFWNPRMLPSAMAHLHGHTSRVVSVAIRQIKGGQVLSVSEDGLMHVWDISSNARLQTVNASLDLQAPVTATLINEHNACIVLCTDRLTSIGLATKQEELLRESHTHECSVVWSQFNPLFSQIVSADESGVVKVFNYATGEITLRFSSCRGAQRLSYACFDSTMRRLLTGTTDGVIKVWNFNVGCALHTLSHAAKSESNQIFM